MNYTYLWVALGALTMFMLGTLSISIVEERRIKKVKEQNKKDRLLQYKIDERICSVNGYGNLVDVRDIMRTMNSKVEKLTRKVADLSERLDEEESVEEKAEIELRDSLLNHHTITNQSISIRPNKVMYKGVDLLKHIQQIEGDVKDLMKMNGRY